MDIISYEWFKRRECPVVRKVRDGGGKGWICETVRPTMHNSGWCDCIQEYNYGLFKDERPKDMAVRLLLEAYSREWLAGKRFVYYAYRYSGNNNYMDCLYVFYKIAAKV